MRDGTPYRPSNGTAGEGFIAHYCDQCKRDKAYRDGTGDSCSIVADTFVFDVTDPHYPKEWVWLNNEPVCTAFDHEDNEAPRITDEERAAQEKLFA